MREGRLTTAVPLLALLSLSSAARAGEAPPPQTAQGTVARLDKARLELKTPDGKLVTFRLTEKTVFERGAASASVSTLKPGEAVTVESSGSGSARTARRVRAAARAAVFVCPMHPEVTSDKPGTCPKCGMALERAARTP